MAQSVGTGGLQYRPAIAVNDNGCKRRRIIFDLGVTVTVTGMCVMGASMMVAPRVGDIAGDSERRRDRGTRQQAVTKPRTGFEFYQCHW